MWPVLPELHQTGHAEDVEVEADPGEGEDDPQAPQHQTVQLDHPAEGGEAGALELQGEQVSLPWGPGGGHRPVVTISAPLIT